MQTAYAPNHTVDATTGFMESNGFIDAFDAERKKQFLDLYRANGLKLIATCSSLGLSKHTVNKHYQLDPVFKQAFDQVEAEVAEAIEAKSVAMALTDKGVIDRMCQLKRLFPGKYAPEQMAGKPIHITINIDGKSLTSETTRAEIVDAETVEEREFSVGDALKVPCELPSAVNPPTENEKVSGNFTNSPTETPSKNSFEAGRKNPRGVG